MRWYVVILLIISMIGSLPIHSQSNSNAGKRIKVINRQQTTEYNKRYYRPSRPASRSKRSRDVIERDRRKAIQLLKDMENQYENCSWVVMQARYRVMIANQKQRIKQLEDELRHASH